jgi:hypothetical protein
MTTFIKPTNGFSRTRDNFGSGQYNAPRDGGTRLHKGLDLISAPGEMIKSPISGTIIKEVIAYADDPQYKGVLIKGTGEFADLEVKILYVRPLIGGNVKAGDIIGMAQDITLRYPGITNHIHMEVLKKGVIADPTEFYNYCF